MAFQGRLTLALAVIDPVKIMRHPGWRRDRPRSGRASVRTLKAISTRDNEFVTHDNIGTNGPDDRG